MSNTCSVILLLTLIMAFEGTRANEKDLYRALFTYYNKEVRPRNNSSEAVEVLVGFELSSIKYVDESMEILHTVGFLSAEWYDEYLAWDPAAYSGLRDLVVHPSLVWLPDMGILNSADTFYHDSFATSFRVHITYTGKVAWAFGGNFATTCDLDMTYYPLDSQVCYIRVENWAYTGQQVTLNNKSNVVNKVNYKDNGIWHVADTGVEKRILYYDHAPGVPYTVLMFEMDLERKDSYFIVNLLAPCILLMLVSQGVFWLPAECGEKVSLGITILLAFSVTSLVITDETPRTSDYYPMLSLYVTILMSIATVSTVSAMLVVYIHHHDTKSRPPAIVRKVAFIFFARILCLRSQVPELPIEQESEKAQQMEKYGKYTGTTAEMETEKLASNQGKTPNQGELVSILQELRGLRQFIKNKEHDEAIAEEWKLLGVIVDRTLFFLTTTVIVISTVMCFP